MLTASQITKAISHDRATGQRPSGHFDHDASNSIGPVSSQGAVTAFAAREDIGDVASHREQGRSGVTIRIHSHIDEATGEELFEITKLD